MVGTNSYHVVRRLELPSQIRELPLIEPLLQLVAHANIWPQRIGGLLRPKVRGMIVLMFEVDESAGVELSGPLTLERRGGNRQ